MYNYPNLNIRSYLIQLAMDSIKANKLQNIIHSTKCVCLDDYRQLAKKVLPLETFIYIDSGADDQVTIRNNNKAFKNLVLLPRVLRDGEGICLKTNLFGKSLSMPVGFAPWAMNKIVHWEGEAATAKVASKNVLPFILSTLTNVHPKQITKVNPEGLKLLQAYLCNDWEMNLKLIQIAQKSNFDGIVITVDAQVLGTRRKQIMHKLDSSEYQFPILEEMVSLAKNPNTGPKQRYSYLKNRDLSLNWQTIAKIRKLTKLKIILKGILHPEDAAIAVNYCDAIYVSNHGGRQLDTVPATIEVLPKIASVVRSLNKDIPILIDGGIRTGNDIFKCLALGANHVFVGRPIAYSLIKGEEGVENMVQILKDELTRCMILAGAKSVKDIGTEFVGFRAKI